MLTFAMGTPRTWVSNVCYVEWIFDARFPVEVQCLADDMQRVDEELLDYPCSICTPSPIVTELPQLCHLIPEK
jgi:hypothetical protein